MNVIEIAFSVYRVTVKLFAVCLWASACAASFAGVLCTDPIPQPSNLTATALSPFRIQLNWTSSTATGEYRVQRSPNGTNDWDDIAALSATTSDVQFDDRALPGGLTFFYRVQGGESLKICSDCCTSAFTDVASASTPTGRVICPAQVDLVRATVFFSRPNSDVLKVRSTICLPGDFDVPSVAGSLQVCNAQFPFILNHVGIGVYVFQTGRGLLHYNRRQHAWRFRADFEHQQLASEVAGCGLVNADIPRPGVLLNLPVTVQIGDQSFSDSPTIQYHAVANDRGVVR